jgi:hypothetical protein
MLPTVTVILQVAILIGFVVLALILKSFIPSYLTEKGRNLATKEDIAEITRMIEGAKVEYLIQLENTRAELRVGAHQLETRFAKLHERRAEAIDGLYKRLVKAQSEFLPLAGAFGLSGSPDVEARVERARKAGSEFLEFFCENRLYFDQALIVEFARIQVAFNNSYVTFALDRHDPAEPAPFHERERRDAAWRQAQDTVREHIPALLLSLESRMRVLLGDSVKEEKGGHA